jgi:hypothetical protein
VVDAPLDAEVARESPENLARRFLMRTRGTIEMVLATEKRTTSESPIKLRATMTKV